MILLTIGMLTFLDHFKMEGFSTSLGKNFMLWEVRTFFFSI